MQPKVILKYGNKTAPLSTILQMLPFAMKEKMPFFFCEIGLTFTLLANNPKELCPVPKGTQLNFTSVLLS